MSNGKRREASGEEAQMAMRLKPLAAALLLALSGTVQAEENPASADNLPDLARPAEPSGTFTAGPNGATLDNRFDGKRLLISPEYSEQTGLSLGGAFAFPLSGSAAGGLLVAGGDKKQELLFNAGFQIDEVQRIIFTVGQLRQHLDIGFVSGAESVDLTQNSGAVSYQRFLDYGVVNSLEFNGYLSGTPSRDLADKTYATDTATLYELWNDHRRVAGGRVTGLQGRLGFTPVSGSSLKLGLGGERLDYDYVTGKQSTTRGTAGAEWTQRLASGLNLRAGLDGAAAQNRVTVGIERATGAGGTLGINATAIRGRDGTPDDNRLALTWTHDFGGKVSGAVMPSADKLAEASATPLHPGSTAAAWGSLLDQVSKRPAFLPAQVVAKLDTTATPTRLLAVNKAALPSGSSVNADTGVITTPLGAAVTGIASVTQNGGAFANSGQFALSGNNLLTDPGKITQPAVGVTDTYVVTLNNAGGGTTLVTVLVSHGSVKIDSIAISQIAAPAAPVASAVSITGTAQVGQTLTGHYAYADADADPQGASTFRWLRNGVAISGATASTYTLVLGDLGATISFEVTPVSTVAPTTGAAVASGATAAVTLPTGYISQGGLIWMPNNIFLPGGALPTWIASNAYCSSATILGQTGWRLPTEAELLANRGALTGPLWIRNLTWSSTPTPGIPGRYNLVQLNSGAVADLPELGTFYATCVR